MGLPGHRRTSSHKKRRAAHFALSSATYNRCPKCDKPVKPHRACGFCGTYRGREVVSVARNIKRASKKVKK